MPAAVVLSLLCALPVGAQEEELAYGVLGFKMLHSPADPFSYYVDGRMNHPTTVLIGQVQQHVDTAWGTWMNVSCAYPAFQSEGLTSNNLAITDPRDPQDNFNVTAIWITSASDPYYDFALGGGTAAAATVPLSYSGTLYQCDIFLNAVDHQFSTQSPTPTGHLDLQTLILHEAGHCLGLGHSEDWNDVMRPAAELGGQKRALTARDNAALCTLYPKTGAVGSPCSTDPDCAATALKCVRPPLQDGGMGPALCSKGCTPTVPGACDSPFACKPSTLIAGHPGACLPTKGDFLTLVGAPCTQHGGCGSAVGLCFTQDQLPSGAPAWRDGYCTQACGDGNTPCPAGAECVSIAGAPRCLKTCRLGSGDCRFGYTCVRATESFNLCVSSCAQDQDCGNTSQYLCRSCDGTCLLRQNPAAQVGDLCTLSSQCGPEQFCLKFVGAGDTGICSKNCGTSCTQCAQGSTCHPLADQNLYCLRDCVQGSCPSGYQCGLLPSGKACIPGCTSTNDCPVGTGCFNGECSGGDGGTCALCPADSGVNGPPPPKPDGGAGGGGSGGCGCAASPAAGGLLLPLVLLALRAGTRRRRG